MADRTPMRHTAEGSPTAGGPTYDEQHLLEALQSAADLESVVELLNDAVVGVASGASADEVAATREDGIAGAVSSAPTGGQPFMLDPDAMPSLAIRVKSSHDGGDPTLRRLLSLGRLAAGRIIEQQHHRRGAVEITALYQIMEQVAAAATPEAVASAGLAVMTGPLRWDAGVMVRPALDPSAGDAAVLAQVVTDDAPLEDLLALRDLAPGLHGSAAGDASTLEMPHVLVWPAHASSETVMILAGWAPEGVDEGAGSLLPPVARVASVLRSGLERIEHMRAEQRASEAQQANQAKSEFLSRMSHELRTPLNAVLGFAQLLELDDLGEEAMDSVRHIRRAGDHLLSLVDEVLDIAKIEAGRIALSVEPLAMREVVDEAASMVASSAAERGITLHVVGGSDTWARADRQRTLQIVLNLLSNAVKYNRDGGSIHVRLMTQDGTSAVIVRDSGMGIPDAKMGRLFTPFDRLDADTGAVPGTGLGLALSQRLAEAMGGTLTARSEVGEGSTFTLTVPVDHAPSHIPEHRAGPADDQPPTTGSVLYIEDNPANVALMRRVLSRRPGIELACATDGVAGLDELRRIRPELLLLDLDLPLLDGLGVLEAVRGNPFTSDLPVVIVSADVTSDRRGALKALGVQGWIAKPFSINDVLDAVDQVLSSKGVSGS